MKKLYTGILLIIFNSFLSATTFTILAKSGLNVREEPNLKSSIIASLPFGTIVDAQIDDSFMNDDGVGYKKYTEVIEGKRGFWMKMTFGKIEGYIFSGYGLVGQWVVQPSQINDEYKILKVGNYCDAVNYDPKLNWYALVGKNGTINIKKVEVSIRLIHEYNAKDTLGPENDFWREFPIKIQTNVSDTIFFLLGSKNELDERQIFSSFVNRNGGYYNEEGFLFPEQTFSQNYENRTYTFRAYEEILLDKNLEEGYKKIYQIELNVSNTDSTYNLSDELSLTESGKLHSAFTTPRLTWIGDMNSDKMLDFIYYSHTMSEGCGVCWQYHLFMSEHTTMNIKKVADDIRCNCIN
jgi:hypothetical protein